MSQFDIYGGLVNSEFSPTTTDTNNWSVQTLTGSKTGRKQSWFVTPLNHVFFSVGSYVTDCAGSTGTDNQPIYYQGGNATADYKHRVQGKYGDCGANWAEVTNRQLVYAGFNTHAPYANSNLFPTTTATTYPLDSLSVRGLPTKLPVIGFSQPGYYSMQLNFTGPTPYITEPVKSIFTGRSANYTGSKSCAGSGCGGTVNSFVPGNGVADYFDARVNTWMNGDLSNTNFLSGQHTIAGSVWNKYVMAFACEDSDRTYGIAGPAPTFTTNPQGNNSTDLGWIVATGAPIVSASRSNTPLNEYYTDQQIYSKTELENELKTTYGNSISALNTAWGTSYTQFDSTATVVSGEAYATADGSAGPFTHTLAHLPDRCSVQLLVRGQIIGGLSCGQGISTGTWQGPNITSGTCDYTTGSCTVTFKTPSASTTNANFVCDGANCTVTSTVPLGAVPGDSVTVTGASAGACAITATIATAPNQLQFTYPCATVIAATQNSSIGYQIALPANLDAITVSYRYGGWCNGGTGMMDECGTGANSFGGGNPCTNFVDLSDCTAGFKSDSAIFLQKFSFKLFDTCRTNFNNYVKNVFTVNARTTAAVFLGPDALITWGFPSRAAVWAAAGSTCSDGKPCIDAAIVGGNSQAPFLDQTGLDYAATSGFAGPLVDSMFRTANFDAEQVFKGTASCASNVVTFTADHAAPQHWFTNASLISVTGCSDTSYNATSGQAVATASGNNQITYNKTCTNGTATGCLVTWSTTGATATQAARGAGFVTDTSSIWSSAYTSTGVHPYCGMWQWQWEDKWAENLNWGLKSGMDNWYDGVQATSARGTDPICVQCLIAKTCTNDAGNTWNPTSVGDCATGGEFYDYGDVLTQWKQAAWYWIDQTSAVTRKIYSGTFSKTGS